MGLIVGLTTVYKLESFLTIICDVLINKIHYLHSVHNIVYILKLRLQFQLSISRLSVFLFFIKTIRLSCTVTDKIRFLLARNDVMTCSPLECAAHDVMSLSPRLVRCR